VKALSDLDSDAMQLVIPVLAHGAMKWDSRAGVVTNTVTEKIMIPEGSVKGASELMVCVSPTHARWCWTPWSTWRAYPYGLRGADHVALPPHVVVSQALQKLGIEKPSSRRSCPRWSRRAAAALQLPVSRRRLGLVAVRPVECLTRRT